MKSLADWFDAEDPVELLSHVPNRQGQARRCCHLVAAVLRPLADLELTPVVRSLPTTGYDWEAARATARQCRDSAGDGASHWLRRVADAFDGAREAGVVFSAVMGLLTHSDDPDTTRWARMQVPAVVTETARLGWPQEARHILAACATPTHVLRSVRLAKWLAGATPGDTAAIVLYKRSIPHLVRDVFLPPATFVGGMAAHKAFDPAWRTDTVVALARTMSEGRDFSAMPILADALQDAGCDRADILDHCRARDQYGTPLPHCRGCWLLEAILRPVA